MATVTPNSSSSSTKVIRIQEDEKELLFRLREIYGNDYKKYGEYIKQETAIPPPIKKIYKLLDERKAYRRISDYFHRERAAKKVKDPNSNGLNVSYNRSSIRGITQVPEQLPVTSMDHEMEYDDEIDNNNDDEENRTTTIIDSDQQQPESPAITNGSDELLESNHHNDDEQPVQQQQHSRPPSIITTTNRHRKRILPMTNSRRQRSSIPTSSSNHINNTSKPELLSVRTHLEQALRELDRAIVSKPDYASSEDAYDEHQQQQSQQTTTSYLTNGYRHSKLDDIVRSLSNVVNQQQENARLIIDESSVLLLDDEQQQQQQTLKLTNTQTSIKNVLARLNGLVDRGHTIYDRIESILSEF